jgi:hypothetical protein
VRQEVALSRNMEQLNRIVVSNHSAPAGIGQFSSRNDLPMIVGIVERVPGDLLPGRTNPSIVVLEGVTVDMGMQQSLGVLVFDRDRIIIPQFCKHGSSTRSTFSPHLSLETKLTLSIQQQLIPLQSLLESWRHEGIPRSRIDQHLEMDPEDRQIDDKGENNESPSSRCEVLEDVILQTREQIKVSASRMLGTETRNRTYDRMTPFDIQNPPKIPANRSPNGHKCKQPDHLASQSTSQEEPGSHQISPPAGRKFPARKQKEVLVFS